MTPVYLDTSALVKLLVDERESLALVDHLGNDRRVVSSALAAVETMRACRRSTVDAADVRGLLQSVETISIDQDVVQAAGAIDPPSIRSLDAIHLASAKRVEDPALEFITYDARLADAARSHGLRVVQPGR
jgi:predicted nucleic acid-binding protein